MAKDLGRADFFLLESSSFARNEDVLVGENFLTRWSAMLHLVELVCLDRSPDLVSVQSADGFLINPTRGWAEELKRVAVEQPGVFDAPVVSLQNMLRRLLLVLRFATGMKTTVHLFLCGGAQAVVEAELAVLGDLIRKVIETSDLEIIVFGESVGTEELGGLHSLCRCPEEDEDCLFPYACASCSPLLVIPPTWEEDGQNESAEFLAGVVRNGTLSQESLFNFEEKFEKLYNRVPPRDTVLDLSKCKMETTQKRMASIKNTLSGYYRRFGVPERQGDAKDDDGPGAVEQLRRLQLVGSDAAIPGTAPRFHGGCGSQATMVQKVQEHLGNDAVKYAISVNGKTFDLDDALGLIRRFSEPLISLPCGKLLKSFGRNAGKLKGKMKLSAGRTKGHLQALLEFNGTLKLIFLPDGQDEAGGELLVHMKEDTGTSVYAFKYLTSDESGRSFALVRGSPRTNSWTALNCFYLRGREGEKEDLRRFSDMLKDPPKLEDFLSPSQQAALDLIMALAGGGAQSGTTFKKGFLIRRERAAAAAAGERPRLPASTRAALKATAAAAAVPDQDPPAGRRARPGQEAARGLAQTAAAAAAATAVPSFIVPGSDSESEEAVKEGSVAPVKVKEPGAEINLNNLKDFF